MPRAKTVDPRRICFEFGFGVFTSKLPFLTHGLLPGQKNLIDKRIVEVRDPLIQKELLQIEEQEVG